MVKKPLLKKKTKLQRDEQDILFIPVIKTITEENKQYKIQGKQYTGYKDLDLEKECQCSAKINKISFQIVKNIDRTFVIKSGGVEIVFTLKKDDQSMSEECMKAFSILSRKKPFESKTSAH